MANEKSAVGSKSASTQTRPPAVPGQQQQPNLPAAPPQANLLDGGGGDNAANRNIADAALDRLDDLTWQRLLGLDGSLVFVEHLLWTIALNILFIVLFREFFLFIK